MDERYQALAKEKEELRIATNIDSTHGESVVG